MSTDDPPRIKALPQAWRIILTSYLWKENKARDDNSRYLISINDLSVAMHTLSHGSDENPYGKNP